MDPLVVAGMGCSGVMFLSYFGGMALFKGLWRTLNRATAVKMDAVRRAFSCLLACFPSQFTGGCLSRQRREDFAERVNRLRVVGTKQNDDYYADKVTNLAEYRKWLREQQKGAASGFLLRRPSLYFPACSRQVAGRG